VSTYPTSGTAQDRSARAGPSGWRWFQDRRLGVKLVTVVIAFVVVFTVVLGFSVVSMVSLSSQADRAAATQKAVLTPMQNVRAVQVINQLLLRRMAMARATPTERPCCRTSPSMTPK